MTNEDIPIFTKREFDERLLTLDVSTKLREGDELMSFMAVSASGWGEADTGTLTVTIHPTDPIGGDDNTELNFIAEGGVTGQDYLVALRYTSTMEQALESICRVSVV